MWTVLLTFVGIFHSGFGASLLHCPEGTVCQLSTGHVEATSFDFLEKLTPKQYHSIISLSVRNSSIYKINPKLKYLKSLEYLDLSYNNVHLATIPPLSSLKTLNLKGNNLKHVVLSVLPPNLEELDLSHNLLAQIPKDWKSLKSLKTLHLHKNPIDCDCYNYNVLNYDRLLKDRISIPEAVTCHLPKKYTGKNIASVNCSMEDIMMYDEPQIEGSGAQDIFEELNTKVAQLHEEEGVDDNTIVEDDYLPSADNATKAESAVLEEGSGDEPEEGSGYGIPLCIINCSTPAPVGKDDEKDASPLPNFHDQLDIIGADIFNGIRGSEPETTTTTTTELAPVIEEEIKKESEPIVYQNSNSDKAVELSNITKTGELEKVIAPTKGASTAIYVIIGVGLFLAFVFIICFVKKRKAKILKKNRRELGEEMKPMTKNTNPPVKNNIPEHIPLINGQNGKAKDDIPVLKTFTPLAHPETVHDERDMEHEEDIEVRQKAIPELLTPQRERVTIRASEIPDSVPKTPILIQRHKNSDGEIVTTVMPP